MFGLEFFEFGERGELIGDELLMTIVNCFWVGDEDKFVARGDGLVDDVVVVSSPCSSLGRSNLEMAIRSFAALDDESVERISCNLLSGNSNSNDAII